MSGLRDLVQFNEDRSVIDMKQFSNAVVFPTVQQFTWRSPQEAQAKIKTEFRWSAYDKIHESMNSILV